MKHTLVAVFSALLLGTLALGILAVGAPTAQAAGGGYVNKCGGGMILLDANEKRAFALHNAARRDRDLKPLCAHPALQKAARAHSRDMIERDYFSHDTKGGIGAHTGNYGGFGTTMYTVDFGARG
jgi:uncharacterized protein YkwD